MRRLRIPLILAVLLGALTAAVRYAPGTQPGRALIARALTGQRVGDLGRLRVVGIGGDPWRDFTIQRIDIEDGAGAWASARDVAVSWRPIELLRRRVRITALDARAIALIRRPTLLASGPAGGPLPVSVRIDQLSAGVELAPAFAEREGAYRVDAALDVERRKAASGRISAASLTHPGDFLRIGFAFDRRRLGLEAHAREATGGALAGALGLDANLPFLLDIRAHGSPGAGWFDLVSRVGAFSPATASGRWSGAGAQASGVIDMMASRWLAPWRGGVGPKVTVSLTARAAGPKLYHLTFEGQGAKAALSGEGDIDPGRRRTGPDGITARGRVDDLSGLVGLPGLGPGVLGPGAVSGRLTGDGEHWRLAGEAGIDKLQGPGGLTLARLSGPFQLRADSGDLDLNLQASGYGGGASGLAGALLGPAPHLAADLERRADGRLLLRALSLKGRALDIDGQGERGLLGDLTFQGRARAHDFATAAGGASGVVLADWRASQAAAAAPWRLRVNARGQGLRLDGARGEALLGPAPTFQAEGRFGPAGLAIDQAALEGAGGGLTAAGTVGATGDLRLRFEGRGRGTLGLGPVSVAGVKASGALTGPLEKARLDGLIDAASLSAPGMAGARLRDARLAFSAVRDGEAITGRVGLAGASDQGPARAGAVVRLAAGRLELTDIDAEVGGAAARGGATLAGGGLAMADLTVDVGPGAFLEKGRASGRARISRPPGGARAILSVQGTGLVFPGGAGGLTSLTLSADGPLARLPYRIEARGDASGTAARLSGSGVLTAARGGASATFTGAGRFGVADIRTLAPAQIALRGTGVEGALHLGVGQGRADVTLTDGPAGLSGRAVLSAFDIALLDPDLRGQADGVLTLGRVGNDLVGGLTAHVAGVTSRDLAGSSALGGTLNATFGGGAVALGGQLADGKGSHLSADVRLPATLTASPLRLALDTRAPLSGRFAADGDIGPVWDLVEGGGQSLTGHLVAKGEIGGSLADPRLTGAASIAGGDFEDGAVGLRLRAVTVQAALLGDAVDVARFSAADGAKGLISGSGRLSLVRNAASSFRLALTDFRLFDTTLGQASASGTVNVDRAADGKVRLGGALTIDRALISPTATTPTGVVPMAVVEVHNAADADAAAAEGPAAREPPVALDVTLRAPGGILIKGRGLNLEMSLDAHVGGTTGAPALSGVARVVRGDYDFAGQRFQVEDGGSVHLGSTADDLRLDLTATRDDPTLTAVIKIGGTAATPTLTLSSTPPLPKDDILSQVLFGTSAAQLSGLQAAQLASALAGLAGNGGFDVIGGLRNFAHLDRLAVDTTATTGSTVAGGKYLSNRIYVEISNGSRTGQGAQVEWRLKKHLAIVSRVTTQGDHALSIRWRKDY